MHVTFASAPGSAHKPNEDITAATPHVALILDGLSSPPDLGIGCIHGTPWFVAQLSTHLLHYATTRPGIPLAECTAQALAQVAATHRQTCDLTHTGTPSSSIALLRENEYGIEYLSLFDSVILLDGPDGVTKISDLRVDGYAQNEHEETRRHPIGTPEHQRAVSRLVAAQRPHRNTPDGYWVAGSNPEAAFHALTGAVPRRQVTRAALLSDGASCLAEDYDLTDWPGLLDVLHTHGPHDVIHRVRQAEADDPDGKRWPRYKASDDATALLCLFDLPA